MRDTSVNLKSPYNTKKYFEERLFWSLFFFAFSYFPFEALSRIFNESCGSLLELWVLLFPVWSDFWKWKFWKLWSRIILWANLEQFVAFGQEWGNRPVLYSICYNGVYMLPETVLTVCVAAILLKIPQIKRLLTV